MPNETTKPIQVRFTPEFKRNLRALAKKYRHIRSDVQPTLEQIQAGNFVGDQVSRTGYTIFTIYSKLDQSDISPEQTRRILKEFEKGS
jgi:mRNA-degrading endonuclease RelE of RelBE toxin-antitoxin system